MSVPNTPCSANSIADDWFDWLPDLDLEAEPNAPVAVWPMERPSFAAPLIMVNAPPAPIAIIPPAQIIPPAKSQQQMSLCPISQYLSKLIKASLKLKYSQKQLEQNLK